MQAPFLSLIDAPDSDYVQDFQDLAAVNLELAAHGPSAQRLLRKAILELHLRDYADACETLDAVLDIAPHLPEAHYQRGMAYGLLACVKAGAVPSGPGHDTIPRRSIRVLLNEAAASFAEAVRRNEEDDEAQERLLRVGSILDTAMSEDRLAAMLRGEDDEAPRDAGQA